MALSSIGFCSLGVALLLFLLLLKENSYRTESLTEKPNSSQQEETIDITVAYMDNSGNFKAHKVKSSDLSSSWVWENSADGNHASPKVELGQEESYQPRENKLQENYHSSTYRTQIRSPISPVKLKRLYLRQKRKEKRASELINMSKETERLMEAAAIERAQKFKHIVKGKYNIWGK